MAPMVMDPPCYYMITILKEKMHAIYKGLENYMMCFIVVDILME
jgi:hypothetical protein